MEGGGGGKQYEPNVIDRSDCHFSSKLCLLFIAFFCSASDCGPVMLSVDSLECGVCFVN